jgi:hypothetical protein
MHDMASQVKNLQRKAQAQEPNPPILKRNAFLKGLSRVKHYTRRQIVIARMIRSWGVFETYRDKTIYFQKTVVAVQIETN